MNSGSGEEGPPDRGSIPPSSLFPSVDSNDDELQKLWLAEDTSESVNIKDEGQLNRGQIGFRDDDVARSTPSPWPQPPKRKDAHSDSQRDDNQPEQKVIPSQQQQPQQPFIMPMFAHPNVANGQGMMFMENPMNSSGTANTGMMPFQMVGMMPGMQGMQGMQFIPMAASMPPQVEEKKKPKKRKKKAKGKPRRPLSAYNLFFKDEREAILKSIPGEDDGKAKEAKEKEITWPGKKKTPHGKISFESLAKTIGERWRVCSQERKAHYKVLADADLVRYANEMKQYDERIASQPPAPSDDSDKDSSDEEEKEEEQHQANFTSKDVGSLKRSRGNSVVSGDATTSQEALKSSPATKSKKGKKQEKDAVADSPSSQMIGGYFVPTMMMNQQGQPIPMNAFPPGQGMQPQDRQLQMMQHGSNPFRSQPHPNQYPQHHQQRNYRQTQHPMDYYHGTSSRQSAGSSHYYDERSRVNDYAAAAAASQQQYPVRHLDNQRSSNHYYYYNDVLPHDMDHDERSSMESPRSRSRGANVARYNRQTFEYPADASREDPSNRDYSAQDFDQGRDQHHKHSNK